MSPDLRSIARFIIAAQHRLPVFGRDCSVRLVREGDTLAGSVVTEPGVGFFDGRGGLVHRMSIEEFEEEFRGRLADHRRADPEHPSSAKPVLEDASLFGGPTLSPRPA